MLRRMSLGSYTFAGANLRQAASFARMVLDFAVPAQRAARAEERRLRAAPIACPPLFVDTEASWWSP
jgi:hypothetical protein